MSDEARDTEEKLSPRGEIFKELSMERAYQNSKWGNDFDDKNTLNDWVTYMCNYATKATDFDVRDNHEAQKKFIMKATAIGVACLETMQRNGSCARRHYERETD